MQTKMYARIQNRVIDVPQFRMDHHDAVITASGQEPDDQNPEKQYERKRRMQNASPKICAVCGDRAMGYNFDAITCESCKAFFRRNALKDQDYHRCCMGNKCEITPISRRFCQKCRLLKCFEAGMKKEWIENEEKLLLRKRKRIEKNKRNRSCPEIVITQGSCTSAKDISDKVVYHSDSTMENYIAKNQKHDGTASIVPSELTRRYSQDSYESPKKLCSTSSSEGDNSYSIPLARDTVIRRASTSSSGNMSTAFLCDRRFILPPEKDIYSESNMISIPDQLLIDIIDFCQFCCVQAKITPSPILEFANSFLRRQ